MNVSLPFFFLLKNHKTTGNVEILINNRLSWAHIYENYMTRLKQL